jgi:hypothetical protein
MRTITVWIVIGRIGPRLLGNRLNSTRQVDRVLRRESSDRQWDSRRRRPK